MKAEEKDKFRILVYGIERKGYPKLETLNVGNGVELIFEDFNTKEEFQNYNGVIMFQGIWAKRKTTNDYLDPREYVGDKQNDELRKRVKQLQQLLMVKNGFVCFLMGRMVHDDFDLAKEVRNWERRCHPLYSRTGGKCESLKKKLGAADSENIRG